MKFQIHPVHQLLVLGLLTISTAGLTRAAPPSLPSASEFVDLPDVQGNQYACPMSGIRRVLVDHEQLSALAQLAGPAVCTNGLAMGLYPCDGIDLQSFVSLENLRRGATEGSALWGFHDLNDNREYALVGLSNGTSVVEVTDPVNPRVVGSVGAPESSWREIKVYQFYDSAAARWKAYAYVSTEAFAGLQILDLTGLPNTVYLAGTYHGFDTSHTLYMANVDYSTGAANVAGVKPYLYVEHVTQYGSGNCGLHVLGLDDPTHLRQLSCYGFSRSEAHDIYTTVFSGARAQQQCAAGHDPCEIVVDFVGWGPGNTLRVLDYTDKAQPVVLSQISYAHQGFTHSGWATADDNYLFLQDELDELDYGNNSELRVFDIHDIRSPVLSGQWTGPTHAIDHNGFTLGRKYYMSNYTRGLTVLDISNPTAPVQTGFFDTYPSDNATSFDGAWHTYPYLPSGNILVSNIDGAGGLYVLREQTATPDLVFIRGARYQASSQRLQIAASSSQAPSCTLTATGYGSLTYNAGRGLYMGAFPATSQPDTVTVESSCGGTDTHSVPYP